MHRHTPALAALVLFALPAAYGHGLGMDIVTANIDGSRMDIMAELPDRFGNDSEMLTVTVRDDSGEGVPDVVMSLGVTHVGESLFEDVFLAPRGVLQMEIVTTDGGVVEVSGERVAGAISGSPGNARVSGPIFGYGGLYTIRIQIQSVAGTPVSDTGTHLLDLSVVDSVVQTENPVRFTTKSYYDRISSFRYDPGAGRVTFEMPFDWRESRVSHIPVIHQEIRFPKTFQEFMSRGYEGGVNGVDLFGSSLTVDDFAAEDDRTVHFVLLQDHLRVIKSRIVSSGEPLPDNMVFTLESTRDVRSQMSAFTGNLQVDMIWEPEEILPGQETKFIFTIRDANTGETMRNSGYDFVLVQNGVEIHRSSGVATVGGDFQGYVFAEGQSGPATARIENIRDTGQYVEFSFVVVPEFGTVAALILAVSIGTALALSGRGALGYARPR